MADAPSPSSSSGGVPTVESSITLPPRPAPEAPAAGEGGEWELLVGTVRQWLASGRASQLWQQSRTPLLALAGLIGLLLVLRVYGALIDAINSTPLLPGLLELVGLIWVVRYGVPRLLRSDGRRQLLEGVRSRWQAFRGH